MFRAALDRRFLSILGLTLLLGSVSVVFTAGYFFFGWGGQYKYELFYFPSPIIYISNSLTATGRMLSFVMPIVAFLVLLLSAEAFRTHSSEILSTEHHYQQGALPGTLKFKRYPTGILVISSAGDIGMGQAPQPSAKRDLLSRLFPYDAGEKAVQLGRTRAGLTVGRAKEGLRSPAGGGSGSLLTKT